MRKFVVVVMFAVLLSFGCATLPEVPGVEKGRLIAPGPVCWNYSPLAEIVALAEAETTRSDAVALIDTYINSGDCDWYSLDMPVIDYVVVEKIGRIVKVNLSNAVTGVVMLNVWVYVGNLERR